MLLVQLQSLGRHPGESPTAVIPAKASMAVIPAKASMAVIPAKASMAVIPAKAGIHLDLGRNSTMDPGFRRNDDIEMKRTLG